MSKNEEVFFIVTVKGGVVGADGTKHDTFELARGTLVGESSLLSDPPQTVYEIRDENSKIVKRRQIFESTREARQRLYNEHEGVDKYGMDLEEVENESK